MNQKVKDESLYMAYSLVHISLVALMFLDGMDLFTLVIPMESAQ